jgi:hypothetical protein
MATHLLNIFHSSAINNEIPHTHLYNTKPNYTFLRVLVAFANLMLTHPTNLDLGLPHASSLDIRQTIAGIVASILPPIK